MSLIKSRKITQETLSDRLNSALQALNITQAELARRIKVSPQAINYLCKSKTKKSQLTYEIANALEINGEWLSCGSGYMNPNDDPQYKFISEQNRVPVITYSQLKNFSKNNSLLSTLETSNYLITTTVAGEKGFAIQIQDKSMYPRFDQDTVVIINPDKKPKENEFVLALLSSMDDIVFRQIKFEGEFIILKSTNTAMYKQITLGKDDKIIGTMVEARWHS